MREDLRLLGGTGAGRGGEGRDQWSIFERLPWRAVDVNICPNRFDAERRKTVDVFVVRHYFKMPT